MTRIQLRRATSAQWASANPILAAGEPGLDLTTGMIKLGDGTTRWSTLLPEWAPASMINSAPRGIVIIGAAIDGVALTAGNTYLTGLITYTFDPKRRYRLIYVIRALGSVAGYIHFQVLNQPTATVLAGTSDQWFSTDRNYNGGTFSWLLPSISGSYSLGLRVSTNYTANIIVYGRDYYIEDVGAFP